MIDDSLVTNVLTIMRYPYLSETHETFNDELGKSKPGEMNA